VLYVLHSVSNVNARIYNSDWSTILTPFDLRLLINESLVHNIPQSLCRIRVLVLYGSVSK